MDSKKRIGNDGSKGRRRYYLVIRVGKELQTHSGPQDVIAAHNELLVRHATVAFGKFGKPLSETIIDILSEQIAEQIPTYLYLVRKVKVGFESYRAPLSDVVAATRSVNVDALSPAYKDANVSTWLVVSDGFVETNIEALFLRSNERPLIAVISETRTPAMLVYERLDNQGPVSRPNCGPDYTRTTHSEVNSTKFSA